MFYGLLADLIVAVHVFYVAFVVVGQLAIWVGLALRCEWARSFWFRILHVLAIAIVVGETVFHVECPLTTWERGLREVAGQDPSERTFVGRMFDYLLFYQGPQELFDIAYYTVGGVILLTFLLAPPRWRKSGTLSNSSAQIVEAADELAPEAR